MVVACEALVQSVVGSMSKHQTVLARRLAAGRPAPFCCLQTALSVSACPTAILIRLHEMSIEVSHQLHLDQHLTCYTCNTFAAKVA